MAAMLGGFFPPQIGFGETFARVLPYALMPAHGWLFLATPGDLAGLHEMQPGFLFAAIAAHHFRSNRRNC
jgi:hypothetical protein